MKSLSLLTLFFFIVIAMVPIKLDAFQSCETNCTYEGCDVEFTQDDFGWTIDVECDDGYQASDSGFGGYTGTICGGVQTCDPYFSQY